MEKFQKHRHRALRMSSGTRDCFDLLSSLKDMKGTCLYLGFTEAAHCARFMEQTYRTGIYTKESQTATLVCEDHHARCNRTVHLLNSNQDFHGAHMESSEIEKMLLLQRNSIGLFE